MKKLYICPMTEIVKVVTSKMILAASIAINDADEDAVDASGASAREGGGFWDDDDE